MANRFPLIIDTTDGNKIKELPSGDDLNLENSSIVNAVSIETQTLTVNGVAITSNVGSYNDLTDKPNIPSDVSHLTDAANLFFSRDYNDLSNLPALFPGDFASLTSKPTTLAGYGITDALQAGTTTLTDLNITDGPSGYVLATDGANNFAFVSVNAATGNLNLTDLSVTQNAASGTGTLTYNNGFGVFTYTPPDLTPFATIASLSAVATAGDFASLTSKPTTLVGYGITDAATSAQGALADSAVQPGDTFRGDHVGSVYADDSTQMVDAVAGKIVGPIETNSATLNGSNVLSVADFGAIGIVISDGAGNFTATTNNSANWDTAYSWGDHSTAGYLLANEPRTGDVTGSVFGDDSTLLVDGVNSVIPYSVLNGVPTTIAGFGITDADLDTITNFGNSTENAIMIGGLEIGENYSTIPLYKNFEVGYGPGDNKFARSIINMTSFGGATAPALDLGAYRESPANNDRGPQLLFRTSTTSLANYNIAQLNTRVLDITSGSEDGQLSIAVAKNGVMTSVAQFRGEYVLLDADLRVKGNIASGPGFDLQLNGNTGQKLILGNSAAMTGIEIGSSTVTTVIKGDLTIEGDLGGITIDPGSISLDLSDLNDTNITSPTNGAFLRWDGSNWIDQGVQLDGLSDVTITSPVAGQVLKYNGSQWTQAAGYGTTDFTTDLNNASVNALNDVDTTTTAPIAGQALIWSAATNTWVPGEVAAVGNFVLDASVIDTDDSSGINVVPQTTFNSDVTVDSDLTAHGRIILTGSNREIYSDQDIILATYVGDGNVIVDGNLTITGEITAESGSGTAPELLSQTDLLFTAEQRVKITSSPLQLADYTDLEKDSIVVEEGDTIFNTDSKNIENYAKGKWNRIVSPVCMGSLGVDNAAVGTPTVSGQGFGYTFTDVSSGIYDITFDHELATDTYAINAHADRFTNIEVFISNKTTTGFRVEVQSSGTPTTERANFQVWDY